MSDITELAARAADTARDADTADEVLAGAHAYVKRVEDLVAVAEAALADATETATARRTAADAAAQELLAAQAETGGKTGDVAVTAGGATGTAKARS